MFLRPFFPSLAAGMLACLPCVTPCGNVGVQRRGTNAGAEDTTGSGMQYQDRPMVSQSSALTETGVLLVMHQVTPEFFFLLLRRCRLLAVHPSSSVSPAPQPDRVVASISGSIFSLVFTLFPLFLECVVQWSDCIRNGVLAQNERVAPGFGGAQLHGHRHI